MPSPASLWRALRTVLLVCSIAAPVPLVAQQQAEMVPRATAGVAGAPTQGSTAHNVPERGTPVVWSPFEEVATSPLLAPVAVQERARGNTHIAMMGVGAAAVVVGLIIGGDDGDVIATVGGVVGVVGLIRYLR